MKPFRHKGRNNHSSSESALRFSASGLEFFWLSFSHISVSITMGESSSISLIHFLLTQGVSNIKSDMVTELLLGVALENSLELLRPLMTSGVQMSMGIGVHTLVDPMRGLDAALKVGRIGVSSIVRARF